MAGLKREKEKKKIDFLQDLFQQLTVGQTSQVALEGYFSLNQVQYVQANLDEGERREILQGLH